MEKIETGKLLNTIISGKLKSGCTLILSDEPIFQKLAEDVLIKTTQKKPRHFIGPNALLEYTDYIRQNSLFEPIQDAFLFLDDKFNFKKYTGSKMNTSSNTVFVFGKTSLRNTLHADLFPNANIFLCYSPKEFERQKCAEILAMYYLQLNSKSTNTYQQSDIENFSTRALQLYNNSLYHCVMHFERMEKAQLSFEDAKLMDASVSSFDIIDALLQKDTFLLQARLDQYFDSGEESSAILNILIYFLKQVIAVQAELSNHNNINIAFKNSKIPYPAQENVKKALQVLSYKKIEHFFSVCAQLEMEIRERKKSNHLLFMELNHLMHS